MRAYRAAVSKEVDSIVVTRSVGDVPLFAHTPLGKALLQFKTYNLASHQRVLLRGMQEGRAQFTSMMVGMTSVGLLSAWLRAYAVGGERYERFKTAAENPGYLLGEALDASGFFALPIEAAATVETMTGVNPVKDPLMAAFPDAPQSGQGVRRIGVDPVGKLLGPTAGLIADVSKAAGAPIGGGRPPAMRLPIVRPKRRNGSCRSRAISGCGRHLICSRRTNRGPRMPRGGRCGVCQRREGNAATSDQPGRARYLGTIRKCTGRFSRLPSCSATCRPVR